MKIELEPEIITLLESDEKRFFWEATSKSMVKVTFSAVKRPMEDDPSYSTEIGQGLNIFSQFSKYKSKKLFSEIKSEQRLYLRFEKIDTGDEDETRVEVELRFMLMRYFQARPGTVYNFNAENANDLRLKLKYFPGKK